MRKYDWLHFILFIVTMIYFEWYRRMLSADLIRLLNESADNWRFDNGMQDLYANLFLVKVLVWSVYGMAQTRIIFKYKKENESGIYRVNIFKWIKKYNFILILFFSSMMAMSFLKLGLSTSHVNEILTSMALAVIITQLFFKPDILYGLDPCACDMISKELSETECCKDSNQACSYQMFDDEKKIFYLQRLANLMHISKPFLRKGYMIKELAIEVDIPLHHLSHLINRELNVNYQDYMNQQRVEYLKDKFNEPEWQQLSLEGMAWQVGFKSRTTFFRAFIKFTGYPPSKYFSIEHENKKVEYENVVVSSYTHAAN